MGFSFVKSHVEDDGRWKFSLWLPEKKDVSRLWVGTYEMRYGFSRLRMGGIASVRTDEEYRNKGYSRKVMEHSTEFMMNADFSVAMLFGIPNFYSKFGYSTVLPETWLTLDSEKVPLLDVSYRVRFFEESDKAKVLALYADNNFIRTGTVVRDATWWAGFGRGTGFCIEDDGLSDMVVDGTYWNEFARGNRCHVGAVSFVVVNRYDNVVGYFVVDDRDEICHLADIGYGEFGVFDTVVNFLGMRARNCGVSEIRCSLPADHAFAIYCRRYGCRVESYYPVDHSGMMRVIDQTKMFKGITSELESRLAESVKFCWWAGKIVVATELGTNCLDISRASIMLTDDETGGARLELPQSKLIELVMGRRGIEDILADPAVSFESEDSGYIDALNLLFPIGNPHLWWTDRF